MQAQWVMGSWAYVPADVPDARLRVRILKAPRECEVKKMAAISTDVEMERKRKVRAHATTRRRLDFGFRAGIVGAGEAVQRPQAGDPPRAVLPLHAALARQRAPPPLTLAFARACPSPPPEVPVHWFNYWVATRAAASLTKQDWEHWREHCTARDRQVDHNDENHLNNATSNLFELSKGANLRKRKRRN